MKNLALLRKKFEISQQKLGKDVGLARNTICQYENGNRVPDVDTLIKLADYFNVSVDYLLGHDVTVNNSVINRPNYEIDFVEKFGDLLNNKEFIELTTLCHEMTNVQIGIVLGFAMNLLQLNGVKN